MGPQLAAGELQSSMETSVDRPSSAPPPSAGTNGSVKPPRVGATLSSPAVPVRPASFAAAGNASKAKGMHLGTNKVPAGVPASSSVPDWAQEAAAEIDAGQGNPWGNDDLMDVNADQDDWSAFFGEFYMLLH